MLKMLCLSALLLTSTAALAAETDQTNPVPAVKVDPRKDPTRKICRRDTPTGSMMAKTTCHTKAEWEAQTSAAQAMTDRMNRQGGSMNP